MTISYGALREWDAGPLEEAAGQLQGRLRTLGGCADDLRQVEGGVVWLGAASSGASEVRAGLADGMDRVVESVDGLRRALHVAADGVSAIAREVVDLDAYAASSRLRINADGSVDVLDRPPVGATQADVDEFVRRRTAQARAVADDAARVVASAVQVDAGVLAALATVDSQVVPDGSLGPGGGSLEDILRDYQVADDQVTTWEPGWPLSMFADPVEVTESEARLLDQLGAGDLLDFRDIRDRAFDEADSQFPPPAGDPLGQNDNHNDAFRHTYWNALLAARFGNNWTEDYTTAHERVPGNQPAREAMDLYNNQVGRQIAAAHPGASQQELAGYVREAVDRGQVLVIDAAGNLAWSNGVPVGGTGHPPEDAAPLPGQVPQQHGDGPES